MILRLNSSLLIFLLIFDAGFTISGVTDRKLKAEHH
jgi:hypothetical protein